MNAAPQAHAGTATDVPVGAPELPRPQPRFRPRREPPQSPLRWRIALTYAGVLIVAAGILLLFVNTAARLARVPGMDVQLLNPVNGFGYSGTVVSQQVAAEHQQTLDQLRFYSVLGFAIVLTGGLVVGWIVSGRALRPIGRIAAVAERISASNLKERIGLTGPDDELKRLADSFDEMVDRLDLEFERQRQFVADASHELRTPLTALQLGIDSIRVDPDATIEDYRRVADDAAEATLRMRRLVEDLLALADGSAPPPPGPVALGPLAEAVCDELEPLAAARSVEVLPTIPGGVVAVGDGSSLRRVLRNLVENAIRYNREGGHVVVEAAAAPPGYVAIAVRDDGIGIPAEAQQRIFDRFYRVDRARSRVDGGSGLGLSIVAKLVASMAGSVSAESWPGQGSRFTVLLPAAKA
ncbi:MAG TPA: HAMP domain-containing sensor histidine kinase [Candidatus Dormibacteraeota bacterium]|nr:HAMP domain-containing sensor histidine kinase [Candidatus Dormibacteraeota bacterium]